MLIVHLGAGSHSRSIDHKYRRLLRRALVLPLQGAARRVEHSALTNTGYGAALDAHGAVSCDATVVEAVDGRIDTALSLLAVGDSPSPTEACLEAMRKMDREWAADGARVRMGLLRPAVMISREPEAKRAAALVLEGARALYNKYDAAFQLESKAEPQAEATSENPRRTGPAPHSLSDLHHHRDRLGFGVLDTVGYIEVAARTRVAASLGGMWLRPRGRVSCAGVPGAGAAYASAGAVEVSCVCSGNGDDIVRMGLAAHVCDELVRAVTQTGDGEENPHFVSLAPLLVSIVQKRAAAVCLSASHNNKPMCYVGVLACVRTGNALPLLVFCHSTESFYFGFRARRAHVVLSRQRAVGTFVSGEYILRSDERTEIGDSLVFQ